MSGTANSMLGYLTPEEQQVNRLFQMVMSNPVGTEQISPQATSSEGQPFQPVAFWGGRPVSQGFRDMVDLGTGVSMGFAGSTNLPGIRAYHGSPHSFERFDASRIGTGEGAQAYGHGLYFAENEGVAKSYKDAGPASSAAFDAINQRLSELAKVMDREAVPGSYRKFRTPEGEAAASEYDALMQKKAGGLGSMYEVNIKADPEHFLDWDKPLSQQSERVQQAMRDNPRIAEAIKYSDNPNDPTGMQIHNAMSSIAARKGGNPVTVAETIRDAGIPGIRYLDQNSRAAGEGTSNYVTFSDDIIDILRKYGIAGLMLGGAGAVGTQRQSQ